MDDIAIRVTGLGKRYDLGAGGDAASYRTLRDEVMALPGLLLGGKPRKAERLAGDFWALRDVSFEVRKGEVLGVVGRNGAGKSTLLKILSRVVEPTEGWADIQGRVGSLLEVGTGFHPELTGRENIFLSGAILGMRRKEVAARLDEIVRFAGIERFLDTPCKKYSSGMFARLGFAVAAHLDADVLLLDEILSVGDAEFRLRCQKRIRDLMGERRHTVFLVSHDFAVVRALCGRVLWMEQGRVRMLDETEKVLAAYHRQGSEGAGRIAERLERVAEGIRIDRVRINGSEARRVPVAAGTECLEIEICGGVSRGVRAAIEVRLYDSDSVPIGIFSPGHETGRISSLDGGDFTLHGKFRLPPLLRGLFLLRVEMTDPGHQGWMDTGCGIELDVEGPAFRGPPLQAGATCGHQLLPSVE